MIAIVSKKRQVSLPAAICEQLGIKPGIRLDFRVKRGKLEAVKVQAKLTRTAPANAKLFSAQRRNVEELLIQKGCSCAVPEDFPQ